MDRGSMHDTQFCAVTPSHGFCDENAARAVRGQNATPEYPSPLGTYLPGYPAPSVPTPPLPL